MDSLPPIISAQKPVALYTPLQVRIASFVGGPFAAVYTLHHNFAGLKQDRERRLTLYWGLACNIAIFAVIPFLPDKFPNSIIPLAYTIGAGQIAASRQLTSEAIRSSGNYVRCSVWNVVLVSVVALIACCGLLVALLMALEYFGFINLA